MSMHIKDLRTIKPQAQPPPISQVITVLGPKGGVGKTVVAGSVAIVSSVQGGRKTLLLDMALDSGDVGIHFDLPEGKSISDLAPYCTDPRPETVARFVTTHERSNVDVILAPPRPELSEFIRSEQVGSLVDCARRQYQCVVIDTPPSLDCDLVYECLEHSDVQILVVTQDLACLRQARTSLELLRRLGHNVKERCHVLINRYYERGLLTRAKIVDFLGLERVSIVSDERDTVDKSILDGTPVALGNRSSTIAQELCAFARTVLGLPGDETQRHKRGLSWFRKGRAL